MFCLLWKGKEPLRDLGAGRAGLGTWVTSLLCWPSCRRGCVCMNGVAGLSLLGHLPDLIPVTPHHSEPPHPSCPRSHRCRHTATAWRCSDGSGIQTEPLSRTCLGRSEATVRKGRG